ncbi:MAG: carbonic anhydrase [Fimbriimonadaceae bacterium]|nr:carbonic anhydrase [Chitinophagales bacterium]
MHEHDNEYKQLLLNNTKWVEEKLSADPDYFKLLSKGQNPPFLYIGCSDSRLPIDVFTGANPGQIFIHRNVANQVFLNDMNLLTVLEFAIKTLKVKHVIICGHYDCGGIQAAYNGTDLNLVENWTMNVRDIAMEYKKELDAIENINDRINRLSELNVIRQLRQLCKTSIMHEAFKQNNYPQLHGWVLDIAHGKIIELELPVAEWKDYGLLPENYL